MKTLNEFLHQLGGTLNWDFSELEECSPESATEAEKELREYIQDAVKADREHLLNHALLISYYEPEEEWNIDMTQDEFEEKFEDEYDCTYKSPYVSNGRLIFVDKNSIINAPFFDLK